MVRVFESDDRMRLDHRRFHARGQIPGSAHIALGHQPFVSGNSVQLSPSSSPSNGNLNWTVSLDGGSSGIGLGGLCLIRLVTSLAIRQSLADDAANRELGAFLVINTKGDPVAVAEIELGQIPMQVLFRDVEIAPVYAALEDR